MEVGNNSNFIGENKYMLASGGVALTVSLAVSGVAIALIVTQGSAMLGLIIFGGTASGDIVLVAIGSVAICRKKKTIEDEPDTDSHEENQIDKTHDHLVVIDQVLEDLVVINKVLKDLDAFLISESQIESESEVDLLTTYFLEVEKITARQKSESPTLDQMVADASRIDELELLIASEKKKRSPDSFEEDENEIEKLSDIFNLDSPEFYQQNNTSKKDAIVINTNEITLKNTEAEKVKTISFGEFKEVKNRLLKSFERIISALLTSDANFREKRKGYVSDREKMLHKLMEDLIFLTDDPTVLGIVWTDFKELTKPNHLLDSEAVEVNSIRLPYSKVSILDFILAPIKKAYMDHMSAQRSHEAHLERNRNGYDRCALCVTEEGRDFGDLVESLEIGKLAEIIPLLRFHQNHLSKKQKSDKDCQICSRKDYEDLRDYIEKIKSANLTKMIDGLAEPAHQAHLCELCSTFEGRGFRDDFERLDGVDFEAKIDVLRQERADKDLEVKIASLRVHEAKHCKLCATKKGRSFRDHAERMKKQIKKIPVPMFVAIPAAKAFVKLVLALGKDEDNGTLVKVVNQIKFLKDELEKAKGDTITIEIVKALDADPKTPKIIYDLFSNTLELLEPFLLNGYLKKENFRGFLGELLTSNAATIIGRLDACLKEEDYEAKMKGIEQLADFVEERLIHTQADIRKKR